jgi:DNA modification methylase
MSGAGGKMPVEISPATLHLGDCLEVLRGMEDNSVHAIVTDPPYGLMFMGGSGITTCRQSKCGPSACAS